MRGFRSAVLLTTALTSFAAHAGVIESGQNFPSPVVAGGNVFVGSNGGTGTLTINNGEQFSTTGIFTGASNNSNGTLTIDGTGTKVTLTGTGFVNRFDAGTSGTGKVTISGGAVVDAASAPGCAPLCSSVIGGSAGSTGNLTITGAGSTYSAPGNLFVGQPGVTPGFGVPGGTASGTVQVLAGGTLNSQTTFIGAPGFGNLNGSEVGSGRVTVDGSGSTWNAVIGNGQAVFVGRGKNVTGEVVVSHGAALNVSGGGASGSAILLGGSSGTVGGSGSLTVDGGTVTMSGIDPVLTAGRNQGTGAITIKNGGSVSGVFTTTVGRNGSTGSLAVNGPGSTLAISGADTSNSALLSVGTVDANPPAPGLGPTTTGTVAVTNGGKITIDTTGNTSGGFISGTRGATGTINVSGPGSQILVFGNGGPNAAGSPSGFTIGRSGTSNLNITGGGNVTVNDTSAAGTGSFVVGGSGSAAANHEPAGTGAILVSGSGSRLDVLSAHGFSSVGRSANGTLTIEHGGAVTGEGFNIARDPGSVGALALSGASSTLTLAGDDGGGGPGARLQVGRGGAGGLSVDGSVVSINSTAANGGVFIGGTSDQSGGIGTATLTNGAKINISGTGNQLVVGNNGTGALTVAGGSRVDVAHGVSSSGKTLVGNTASTGALVVTGSGSSLSAGSLLGIGSDGTKDTGIGSALVKNNGTITSTSIVVGSHGVLGGNGTINGNVTSTGTLQVGASPDALRLHGALSQSGGEIKFDIASNGKGGFLTSTLVFDHNAVISLNNADFDFSFESGTNIQAFLKDGLFKLDTFLRVADGTGTDPLDPLDQVVTGDGTSFTGDLNGSPLLITGFDLENGAQSVAVPEPGTAALLLSGLAGLSLAARRRRRG